MPSLAQTFDYIVEQTNARKNGAGWKGHCPAHEDRTPSLSISHGDNGGIVAHCHAGCEQAAVVAALGLGMADLFPPRPEAVRQHGRRRTPTQTTRYPLHDSSGAIVAVHVRIDKADGAKAVHWELPDGRKGLGGIGTAALPLYGFHDMGGASELVVCEGERAADALRAVGIPAVGTVTGAASIPGDDSLRPLIGRHVCLWPDNDEQGRKHMGRIAERLRELGQGADAIRRVSWDAAPDKGDAADWRGTADALRALIADAPAWGSVRPTSFVRSSDVPPYPLDVWPTPLADYFAASAASMGIPVDMVATFAAPIIAATIGNRRPLLVKPGYVVRPQLWTAVIAGVSTGKSGALEHALALVAGLQSDAVDQFDMQLEAWEKAQKTNPKANPKPRPVLQHFYTNNATLEWFGPAARDSAGIAMVRDELLGWFRDFDAYRSGKGGDRQTWLSLWSGGALKIDRRGADTIYAEHPVVTVTGGIQPDRLPELAKDAGADGFLARFLLAMPKAQAPGWTDDVLDRDTLNAAKDVVRPLRHGEYRDPLPLSSGALDAFREFCRDNTTTLNAGGVPEIVKAAYGKFDAQAAKLALVLHCCHDPYATLPDVPYERVRDAIELVEYHAAHAITAYKKIGVDTPERLAGLKVRIVRILRTYVVRNEGGWVSRSELLRSLGNVKTMDLSRELSELSEAGIVESRKSETATKPGEAWRLTDAA